MNKEEKIYECECGRTFNNLHSFSGHRSHCVIHLGEEKYNEALERSRKAAETARKAIKEKSENFHKQKELEKKQWESEGHLCERCGEVMTELYGSGRFCSKSCASARNHTEESRLKTRASVKEYYAEYYGNNKSDDSSDKYDFSQYVSGTKELYLNGIANYRNLKYYKIDKVEGIDFVICPYCGARMADLQEKHLSIHNKTRKDIRNEFGENYQLISEKTNNNRSKSGKEAQQKLVKEGRHKGWQSRNIRSYAELFWEKVLDNNGIKYISEHVLTKKSIGINKAGCYFLDFFIDGFIDLEIDGKQHEYEDRKQSDKKRDKLLKMNGVEIYRIQWINPKDKETEEKVKKQIDDFLNWYNKIKDEEGIIVC